MQLHVYQGISPANKNGLSARLNLPHPEGVSVQAGDAVLLLDPVAREGACYGYASVMLCELSSGLRCTAQPLYLNRLDVDHCFDLPGDAGEWHTIDAEALRVFGGAAGVLDYLRQRSLYALLDQRLGGVREQAGTYQVRVRDAIARLYAESQDAPTLTHPARAAVQDDAFRVAVKGLYRFRCGVCGVSRVSPGGRFEVEAVHIYPKASQGSDDLRNGLALCRLHAWAFEQGLFGLDDGGRVVPHPELPVEPAYEAISRYAGKVLELPQDERFAPHALFLAAHRGMHGVG